MKKDFFDLIDKEMEQNPDIYLIMAGLGYPRVEEYLKKYPERAINTEASEQTALDIAVGLAYAGKLPFIYTITPFLYRGFETIRTYINHEKLHIVLVGAGRDKDYAHDGFSHDATDIKDILDTQKNIKQHFPQDKKWLSICLNMAIISSNPAFISLRR